MSNTISTLIDKLIEWGEYHSDSILVNKKFDVDDNECALYKSDELTEVETMIVDLLRKFVDDKYHFGTLNKLNDMLQHHKTTENRDHGVSDCYLKIIEPTDEYVQIQIVYGWRRCSCSTYNYHPTLDKFAAFSFSSGNYNGRGGIEFEEFDSNDISFTIDDVFTQVIERFDK